MPRHPGGPGRPKGARNRVGAELAREILQAAAETGFMVRDDKGNWQPSREGGVRGYLRWATINEPKTYLGMIARVLPFNVVQEQPEEMIMTHEQILARLEERGLPTDLVNVLPEAPAELDPGEDPDPFGLMKVVEAQADTQNTSSHGVPASSAARIVGDHSAQSHDSAAWPTR
jgi:hypothetical protein